MSAARAFEVKEAEFGRYFVGTRECPEVFSVGSLANALRLVNFLLDGPGGPAKPASFPHDDRPSASSNAGGGK